MFVAFNAEALSNKKKIVIFLISEMAILVCSKRVI